ncbi:hypothetical protein C1H46_008095 [Malus baccata]|uniref:Uncharacterized protein n=1 Tax=Malus baccata TaxID=106549 RepID=A0A540N5B7_MALBA|nr:hypothetical protein C1H46_008095 [Malus baccata]
MFSTKMSRLSFFCLQIGNPLFEFNSDINAPAEYWWSHGLISDATFENLTSVCNYSEIIRQAVIRGGPLMKIDVCIGDETVTYLNRPDVQEALHARVTNWTTCSK